MGGTLELEDSGKEGSRFRVQLELLTAEDDRFAIPNLPSATKLDTTLRPGSVLYVEDNLSNMKLIQMLLESMPHIELIPALQGQVGIDLARSHQPDLVLLDVHLPDMSGADVLRRLKADPATSAIPVVVISADATQGQIRRLRQSGAYDYLTKPIDIKRFMSLFESIFAAGDDDDR